MDRLKVALQVCAALNIVCIILSIPGLVLITQLNLEGLTLLTTFTIMVFAVPIFLIFHAVKTYICSGAHSWKKIIFHCWIAYNIVFGVGLTIYSLYALFNLGSVSSLDENDKYVYYLYMKIAMPLSVLYCIKMVVITMYYVKRVHNKPMEYRDKLLSNVQVDIQPVLINDNQH